MKYSLDCGLWNSVFAVPSQIVDNHLKMCGAAQLKVLLVLLRGGGTAMELEDIAAFLNFSPGDTQDALNYWILAGLLLPIHTQNGVTLTADMQAPPASTAPVPAPHVPAQTESAQAEPGTKYSVGSAPLKKPTIPDIEDLMRNSTGFKALLQEAEASLGKSLKTSDIASLAAMYDWAGLPVDVVLIILEYCKALGKTNFRYIEKVAESWLNNGIDTFEKAEHYIKDRLEADVRERLIKSAFGIYDRALTTKESEFVKLWLDGYHLDISIIKLAYERCIENTGKMSFPYINKILTGWHSQNITTPEQATKAEEAFSRQKNEPKKSKSSYDIDEFEQFLLRNPQKIN